MKTLLVATSMAALIIAGCNRKADDVNPPSEASEIADVEISAEIPAPDTEAENAPAADKTAALEEAQMWMRANAQRDGIITLPSGLQYEINNSGDASGVSPNPGQRIRVHYEGRLTDGTVFDSSYERGTPYDSPSNAFIEGWNEALSMMKPGDAWTLYVPPNLGYGEDGYINGQTGEVLIPPNAVLIFRMELIDNL